MENTEIAAKAKADAEALLKRQKAAAKGCFDADAYLKEVAVTPDCTVFNLKNVEGANGCNNYLAANGWTADDLLTIKRPA